MRPQLGVCYYPEHWPVDQWEQDARQMAEMGLKWVRIGEFAWSQIEPGPELLNWDWLDRAINVLGQAGLKVILGTPTATPPRWMLDKYPDMLAMDANGHPRKFGSRRHYCFSHEGYRDECARITRKLAERYGDNSHVEAWQIDNEYGCHNTTLSYGGSAADAFRKWLKEKYLTISALNDAWGNVFWSMEYNRFDQIDPPNLTVTEANPAHVMNFRQFSSEQIAAFNRLQCEVLRQYTNAPLIHNYMGRITDFDHFGVAAELDIASWDSYPLGFLEDRSDQNDEFKHVYMRQGDPDFQAFHHDLYRAVGRGRWWVMEQQPGPVNWAPYNPAPSSGMIRLWTWEAIAHGAEVVSYFRWRQSPFGQEQMHAGLQNSGTEWAPGAEEIRKVAKELGDLPDIEMPESPVGLVFDYQSAWSWQTQPQGQTFDYFRLVYDVYRALRQFGMSVDILPPDTDDFGDRKLVCIPGLCAWPSELVSAITKFKGEVFIGPRTGSKTADFKTAGNLPNLLEIDYRVTAVESLRPSAEIPLSAGGSFHIWREFIKTTNSQPEMTIDGWPALISNNNLTYIAGWPNDAAMKRILSGICDRAGLNVTSLVGGHRVRQMTNMTMHMNYGPNEVEINNINLGVGDVLLLDKSTNKSWLAPSRG